MYRPIDRYGLIGDMNSVALVSTDGSIDWACFPRFDSPSVFGAILDWRRGGRFQIAPSTPGVSARQQYLPNTNILDTSFQTETGDFSVTDFMPMADGEAATDCPHEIHRIVRCTRGSVRLRCDFQPRLDYGRATTRLQRIREGVQATGNRQVLSLCSRVPLEISGSDASAEFTLHEGGQATFVLAYGHGRPRKLGSYRTLQRFDETKRYWEQMASAMAYDGLWREQVLRSFLLLHLLVYRPTGAVVAAPTTSLPERVGGERNWDYRFSWLRDSSFTMEALYRTGHVEEAARYLRWLIHQCKVTNGRTRMVYGVSPNSSLKETTLDHLEGYGGSGPVRVGNGASRHLQLDVFGEVILGVFRLHQIGGGITDEAWSLVSHFAEVVCERWRRRDRSVWEVRGGQQHFVYSKVMCWTALDRAARLARALGHSGAVLRWQQTADTIKAEVLELGWSERKQAFVQRYGSDTLDASNLVIPFVGFLPAEDPRVAATLRAVSRELADGPLVRRYLPEETDDGLDSQGEGAFTFLSFWLIGNLIYLGDVDKANDYFEQMMGYSNHLGLFAEMIDPATGTLLGNFPQAYSHIGLMHTAGNLSRALTGRPVAVAKQT